MVALQIISKILQSKDFSIVTDNLLEQEYFVGYEDEFKFISDHYKKYNNVPDVVTFLNHFSKVDDEGNLIPLIELVEVNESDRYLVNAIREEYLFKQSVPVVEHVAKLLEVDANKAAEYMINAVKDLQPNYDLGGTNIVADAVDRYNQYLERKVNQDNWFFTTGFPELDDLIHGLQRGEELMVIVARTNQGKSWVLEKMCTHVWEIGFNVGYISPEMGANSIGYRFDTLRSNFSNKSLMWGKSDIDDDKYKRYIDDLKARDNKFMVASSQDFGDSMTVLKLKNWVKQYKLDMLAVDGITYIDDMRYKKGDSKTTSLTNISEDLMEMSVELGIPVIVVVQANRNGVGDKEGNDVPELESIRDSDGIAHNASKVLSIRQTKEGVLKMQVKKQRFGGVGGSVSYMWDINTGVFTYSPNYDDSQPKAVVERKVKKQIQNKEDVF